MPDSVIHVVHEAGRSMFQKLYFDYPLRMIHPRNSNVEDLIVYLLSFGGGYVSGDSISLRIRLRQFIVPTDSVNSTILTFFYILLDSPVKSNRRESFSTLTLKTQGSSKIFKSVGQVCCRQEVFSYVAEGALLSIVPDPVTVYENAAYIQKLFFCLEKGASLVLVDWFSCGRKGEFWSFKNLIAHLEVTIADQKLICERSEINSVIPTSARIEEKVGQKPVFGTVLLIGPRTQSVRNNVAHFGQRESFQHIERIERDGVNSSIVGPTVSLSTLGSEVSILRFQGETVDECYCFLAAALLPLADHGISARALPFADRIHRLSS